MSRNLSQDPVGHLPRPAHDPDLFIAVFLVFSYFLESKHNNETSRILSATYRVPHTIQFESVTDLVATATAATTTTTTTTTTTITTTTTAAATTTTTNNNRNDDTNH